ncbi:hypothetical protein BC834DRAFT_901662 [Gloeopeniophorella convolvens]|nr:hypothetical protein BC834DRAFT_901662 [Gloeopeniophorella convolvens]
MPRRPSGSEARDSASATRADSPKYMERTNYELTQPYGGFQRFMQSHGLSLHNDDDIQEARQILDEFRKLDLQESDSNEEDERDEECEQEEEDERDGPVEWFTDEEQAGYERGDYGRQGLVDYDSEREDGRSQGSGQEDGYYGHQDDFEQGSYYDSDEPGYSDSEDDW